MLEKIKRNSLIFFSYLKKYWWFILIGGASFWVVLFAKNKIFILNQLLKEREQINQRHQQELDEITRIHQQELAQRIIIEQEYKNTIDRINQSHAEAMENLSKAKRQELKDIISETRDNPELMTSRVNSLFGFTVLKTPS